MQPAPLDARVRRRAPALVLLGDGQGRALRDKGRPAGHVHDRRVAREVPAGRHAVRHRRPEREEGDQLQLHGRAAKGRVGRRRRASVDARDRSPDARRARRPPMTRDFYFRPTLNF